ncbi:hypothetical protein GJ496_004093 [Pomphorhynchus laevis]|nr:hypothetical protein GJ496_004093 [Pomphorhynchus laevis]
MTSFSVLFDSNNSWQGSRCTIYQTLHTYKLSTCCLAITRAASRHLGGFPSGHNIQLKYCNEYFSERTRLALILTRYNQFTPKLHEICAQIRIYLNFNQRYRKSNQFNVFG